MRRILLLAVAALGILSSCRKIHGEGPIVSQNRAVNPFSGIDMSVSGDVYFSEAEDVSVEISAQQNIIDVIQTKLVGGHLVIKVKDGVRLRRHEDITVKVSGPGVRSLNLSGSGNLSVIGPFNPTYCQLRISGSGNIQIPQLTTANLEAWISGSGDIRIETGEAHDADLHISGSGSMDMLHFRVNHAETHTSGSGTIKLHVTNTLDASISGSGTVYYQGNPLINTKISGSGSVVKF
ncbi:MAG TPA: head GIN domain-containing protein [Parasegetibacter sp.]